MGKTPSARLKSYRFLDGKGQITVSIRIVCKRRTIRTAGQGENRQAAMRSALCKAAHQLGISASDFIRLSLRFCPNAQEILRELKIFPYFLGF